MNICQQLKKMVVHASRTYDCPENMLDPDAQEKQTLFYSDKVAIVALKMI